jgi:hypothetical protein
MSSRERRIIFHQIFFILSIFHTSYFACSAKQRDPGLNAIRQTPKADQNSIATLREIFVFFLVMTVGGLWWPTPTYAASCDALVGKWAWFIGGEVTVNPDGTFVQQSGNAGTWECTDAVRGRFTFRWRDGGFVNSLALSPDGQGLTSTDQSQFYVTAQRSESAPAQKPQFIRKEDCCQEEYACETKRIEAEFDQARAQCHHPGNATCNSDAVKTKASQLKAANEKLRLCNRTGTYTGPSSSPKAGDTLPSLPASSDEFYSTEGAGGPCQVCMPTQGTDQASGEGGDIFGSDTPGSDQGQPQPNGPGEVFGSDSPGSDQGQPPTTSKPEPTPPVREVQDDSDCLPQVDPHVLERLKAERDDILRALEGGGYMTDLILKAMGKLIAARLHHMTEPNEGILSRTTRTARSVIEHAPETVVKAGEAVAMYLTNDNAANHRYLYGQVEIAIRKAEAELKQTLRNPHIAIATTADTLLVGKGTAALGTVCRQWTATKVSQFTKKVDQAEKGGNRFRAIQNMEPPSSGVCNPKKEDCFWQTLHNATGDPSYLLRKDPPKSWDEVYEKLKQHFGGPHAKNPRTGRPGDLQMIAEGIPVEVTRGEFEDILNNLPDNSEGMLFILRRNGSSHVLNVARFAGRPLLWDNQDRMSIGDSRLAQVKVFRWFPTK